jgi:RNA polymerase sigma factor (sigma-70 family)
MTHDTAALLRLASEGDQAAWNAIVAEYTGLLRSVVRGFRLAEAEAADAVQTTWLRLVEHLGALRDPACLPGWLRTTASRVCLETIRSGSREFPADCWGGSGDSDRTGYRPEVAADEDGPEDEVVRAEHRRLLRNAVAGLAQRDQALLRLLTCAEPPSYREIGDLLGMPVGSIGPTRARILGRLRAALEKEGVHDAALA